MLICSYRIIHTKKRKSIFVLANQIKYEPDKVQYYEICQKFVNYIHETFFLKFLVKGQFEDGSLTERVVPYIHRWTSPYRNSILAKFYQLEKYIENNPTPLTMLTLTTYQAGEFSIQQKGHPVTISESFEILNKNWKKLINLIRTRIRPGISFVWVLEPHTRHNTGYPHLHAILFTEFTEEEKKRIKKLWSEKYHAGSFEHGVDFSVKPIEESIKSMRNYLMKYFSKMFFDSGSKFWSTDWTTGQLVFNAVARENKYRLGGASRDLSKAMARKIDDDQIEKIKWFKTIMLDGDNIKLAVVWSVEPEEFDEIRERFYALPR